MKKRNNINNRERRLIRLTFEKPSNGGVEKREVVLTGYDGLVLITLAVLVVFVVLVLVGTKIF